MKDYYVTRQIGVTENNIPIWKAIHVSDLEKYAEQIKKYEANKSING